MKRAVDTNVLVRLLVEGDDAQSAAAVKLLAEGELYVAKTVILETEWILRTVFGLGRTDAVSRLSDIVANGAFDVEDRNVVADAVEAFGRGIDFADALHLFSAADCSGFLTFDRKFAKAAIRLGLQPEVIHP